MNNKNKFKKVIKKIDNFNFIKMFFFWSLSQVDKYVRF